MHTAMAAHLPLPIDSSHFDRWLEIFETAREVCPAAGSHFLDRASRMADSLELGIAAKKGEVRRGRPTGALQTPDYEDQQPLIATLRTFVCDLLGCDVPSHTPVLRCASLNRRDVHHLACGS